MRGLALAALLFASPASAVPAFQGCEGFGCETPGGRGGRSPARPRRVYGLKGQP